MTERADLFDAVPEQESMRAPKVPTFDPSDLAPDSGITDSHGSMPGFRFDAGAMGVCLFVVADGVLFGALFGLYAMLHAARPEVFAHGRYFLNPITGAAENSVLLLSCLTAAFAVRFARRGEIRGLASSLSATILLAGFFLGIQGAEYTDKFQRRLLPGRYFMSTEQVWETPGFRREHARSAQYAERFRVGDPARVDERGASRTAVEPLVQAGALGEHAVFPNLPSEPKNAHVFFGLYFLFSGLHALHVLGGAGAWTWLLARARRRSDEASYVPTVDYASLYWNFITVVRVLMFPLFYLVR